jgi:hypothetical protein
MLEYKEAQATMFILTLILLIRAVRVNQLPIADGFHPMDALMKQLKAKIKKEMFIKFIDGLTKNKNPMKQIIGLTLTTTFINAIVGSMRQRLLMKQFKLPSATEVLSLSILLKTDTELSEESTPFPLDNTEIVKKIDKMDSIQLMLFPFPHKHPKMPFFQQPMLLELQATLEQTADALYYYPSTISELK